jgi:hypothetical protein
MVEKWWFGVGQQAEGDYGGGMMVNMAVMINVLSPSLRVFSSCTLSLSLPLC